MSETTTDTPAAEKVKCGHETVSGACIRPLGHNFGHMSKAVLDVKSANAKAKKSGTMTPEELAAKEQERAAKAQERIEAAKGAHAAKLAKLEAAAAEFGFKLVAMSAKEKKDYEAAKAQENTEA